MPGAIDWSNTNAAREAAAQKLGIDIRKVREGNDGKTWFNAARRFANVNKNGNNREMGVENFCALPVSVLTNAFSTAARTLHLPRRYRLYDTNGGKCRRCGKPTRNSTGTCGECISAPMCLDCRQRPAEPDADFCRQCQREINDTWLADERTARILDELCPNCGDANCGGGCGAWTKE